MQHIVPCTVACPLIVFKNFFNQGIIKESLDKIAALFVVRVSGKERSDFSSVVFQGVAGAKQFLLFAVLVIIGDFRAGVKVMVAEFQPCGAYRRPVDGSLPLFFLRREGGGQLAYTSSASATSSAAALMLFIRPTHFI